MIIVAHYFGAPIEVLVDDDCLARPDGWLINRDGYCYLPPHSEPIYLHRFIMSAPTGVIVDHRNGNRLDNRKENLRLIDDAGNSQNLTRLKSNNSSGIRGVCWDKKSNKWAGHVKKDGKKYKRCFDDKEKAAAWATAKRKELGFAD